MMSSARSGVFTCTWPVRSLHCARVFSSNASKSVVRWRAISARTSASLPASPNNTRKVVLALGSSVKWLRNAAQGSSAGPAFWPSGLPDSSAAEELAPIAGPLVLAAAEVHERDAGKRAVPRIARGERARFRLEVGDDVRRARHPRRRQHPFRVGGDREIARARRLVADHQARELDRVVGRHRERELERDAVRALLEAAVAQAMRAGVIRLLVTDRRRRRAPQLAGFLVAQVDSLAGAVTDRVVAPRRERVLAAVARPGVTRAVGGYVAAEAAIGDHVDPGRRRNLATRRGHHVFASLRRESAQAVEEFELARAVDFGGRRGGRGSVAPPLPRRRGGPGLH